MSEITAPCLLAALVSPGVGFSYEQLKTLPLQPEKILKTISGNAPIKAASSSTSSNKVASIDEGSSDYYIPMLSEVAEQSIIGFDKEILSIIEVLARKDRANLLIVGETGTASYNACATSAYQLHSNPWNLLNLTLLL